MVALLVILTVTMASRMGSTLDDSSGSTELESVARQESIIANIFGSNVTKVKKRRSELLPLKIKVFVILHKPSGIHLLYHLIILVIIFFSAIVFNLIDESLVYNGDTFSTIMISKVVSDSVLIGECSPFVPISHSMADFGSDTDS